MTTPLDRHRYAVIVALVASMLLGHVHWLPPAYAIWLFVLLVFSAWRVRHEVRAASALLRLPVLVATLGLLIYTAGSPIGREGGSALLGGLIVLKLLESTRRRDARVLVAAALFFCMIGFLFGQGLTLTLYFCAIATLCFLALHVVSLDGERTWPQLQGDVRRGLRISARVAAAAVPLTIVTFVFFPRLSSPLWGAPWDATQGRTGISDRMRPGALSRLWNDNTPAFRVTFEGEAPPASAQYWRGPVLWTFDGEEWSRPDIYSRNAPAHIEPDSATVVSYEILMEPTERSWWFPLDLPLSIPKDAQISSDGQVRARRPLIGPRSERFRSAWRFRFDARAVPGQRSIGLQLPARGNPRARAIAADWRARHDADDQRVIDEALRWFNREFTYTLEPPPLGRDIVDDFLFNTQAGYCEYFASSFVFLMRAAAIPARVVTGYQGGVYNSAGGYWIVRNADAHAWAEVWLAERGWVRVDPTAAVAPERIDRGSLAAAMPEAARWYSDGWGLEWRNRLDLVARYWRKAVIEFDAVRQRNLLRQVGLEDMGWQALGIGLLIFGAVGLALGVWISLRGMQPPTRDPLVLAYRRFNVRLAGAGVRREPGEGPIAFGKRAASIVLHDAPAILELTRRFAEQRYGESAHDPDASHRQRLAQELRAFRPRR